MGAPATETQNMSRDIFMSEMTQEKLSASNDSSNNSKMIQHSVEELQLFSHL